MFRRKKSQLGPYESARAEDKLVLAALVDAGATLTEPRHVLHFIYDLVDEAAARMASETVAGWQSTIGPPVEGYDTWSVTFERQGYVLTAHNVAADGEMFMQAARADGGRYDGWEASV